MTLFGVAQWHALRHTNIKVFLQFDKLRFGTTLYDDGDFRARLGNDTEAILDLVTKYFHCG